MAYKIFIFQFDIKKSLHNNNSQVVLILFFILEQLIGSHRPRLLGNLIYFYCVNKENMYLNFALVFLICLEKNWKKNRGLNRKLSISYKKIEILFLGQIAQPYFDVVKISVRLPTLFFVLCVLVLGLHIPSQYPGVSNAVLQNKPKHKLWFSTFIVRIGSS